MADLQEQPVSSLKEPELHVVACEVTDPKGCLELFYAAWLDRYASAEIAERPRRDLVYLVDAEAEIDRLRAEVAELAQQRGDLAARVIAMTNERQSLRRIISSDSYAATFQTFGQYRTALLRAIDALDSRPTNVALPPCCTDTAGSGSVPHGEVG